jgi:hypothetical protein
MRHVAEAVEDRLEARPIRIRRGQNRGQQPDREQRGTECRDVDREGAGEADNRDQNTGDRRPDDPRQREDHVLDSDCGQQLVVGHEPRRQRVPRGSLEPVGGGAQPFSDKQGPDARIRQKRIHE